MRPYDRRAVRDLEEKHPFRYRILQVGRREPQKNLETLIRALALLGPDYGLVTMGKGDATP